MSLDPESLAGQPVIVGAGLAGLIAALELAPMPVVVLTKAALGEGAASGWSQGGLAAAILDGDSPALHAADTLAAGDGINDPEAVRLITEAGPAAVALLERLGVCFARGDDGAYACKLEAAHSRRRVLNAGGDGTGAAIMRALIARMRATPSITLIDEAVATGLITDDRGIAGLTLQRQGQNLTLATRAVVLATGGAGGLWRDTTNPLGALGQGLVLAARAGAGLIDLEFVQFHPTALDVGRDPMPLASEALRGEGATLIDDRGDPVMAGFPRGDLEARDIVSRAVWARLAAGRRVFLDTRAAIGADLPRRFPTIWESCREAGINAVTQPIPIRPAAHYHMGGIAVDASGRTGIDGLWAGGEVAATGLHGANRLASNSLLEAVVTGQAIARDLGGTDRGGTATVFQPDQPAVPADIESLNLVRAVMTRHVGVLRDADGLARAIAELLPLARLGSLAAEAALMIAVAAFERQESRGGHARTDFPAQGEPARTPLDRARILDLAASVT
jgi:L-aspartate oxidase